MVIQVRSGRRLDNAPQFDAGLYDKGARFSSPTARHLAGESATLAALCAWGLSVVASGGPQGLLLQIRSRSRHRTGVGRLEGKGFLTPPSVPSSHRAVQSRTIAFWAVLIDAQIVLRENFPPGWICQPARKDA